MKCTLQDRQGRDLICGDGLMNQYFRYASKYNYAQMSMNVMNDAMAALSQKCESPTGNRWLFLCNHIAYNDVQRNLAQFLLVNKAEDYMWSKFENEKIKVGATYAAYEYAGEN